MRGVSAWRAALWCAGIWPEEVAKDHGKGDGAKNEGAWHRLVAGNIGVVEGEWKNSPRAPSRGEFVSRWIDRLALLSKHASNGNVRGPR